MSRGVSSRIAVDRRVALSTDGWRTASGPRTVDVHRRLSTDGHGRAAPAACSGVTHGAESGRASAAVAWRLADRDACRAAGAGAGRPRVRGGGFGPLPPVRECRGLADASCSVTVPGTAGRAPRATVMVAVDNGLDRRAANSVTYNSRPLSTTRRAQNSEFGTRPRRRADLSLPVPHDDHGRRAAPGRKGEISLYASRRAGAGRPLWTWPFHRRGRRGHPGRRVSAASHADHPVPRREGLLATKRHQRAEADIASAVSGANHSAGRKAGWAPAPSGPSAAFHDDEPGPCTRGSADKLAPASSVHPVSRGV